MINKEFELHPLFEQFIVASKTGKRLKKDGSRIRTGTIRQYEIVRDELKRFSIKENYSLVIRNALRMNARALKSEHVYWKRFYRRYTDYLYSIGCFDNYAGSHFKIIRAFFNFLKQEKGIFTGDFHKNFYVRNENIPIVVLSHDQLQFLINNAEFENSLREYLKRTKDIFVFGCTVGLRFSDLMKLTKKNLEKSGNSINLCVRSVKTSTDTKIKLPPYAIDIIYRYRRNKTLLPVLSNARLNDNLKLLCEKAGWIHEVDKIRERRGVTKKINNNGKSYRFCDLITTHTMRRTAITTLLSLGMPETMVRKISGHAANSKEFYRYVNYAQQYIDKETDRIFDTLFLPKNASEKLIEIS